jgi:hypothetical protein
MHVDNLCDFKIFEFLLSKSRRITEKKNTTQDLYLIVNLGYLNLLQKKIHLVSFYLKSMIGKSQKIKKAFKRENKSK